MISLTLISAIIILADESQVRHAMNKKNWQTGMHQIEGTHLIICKFFLGGVLSSLARNR